ncbi:MAG TPA: chemotaxis protein CheD [Longimicrobiales bacterium]|nr:chemotaxis protein CheD [Longimicrobiales bacterium]
MKSPERIPVRIGEVRVAGRSHVLYTIGLGSCVAIAIYDPKARIGGLAHAMLPEQRNGSRPGPPGRYATGAVHQLLAEMEAQGASPRRLRARLAGGASMFRNLLEGEGLRLGRRNVEAARAALAAAGVPVDGEDVFGTYGRSVFLNTSDGEVRVTSVRHPDVLL